MTQISRTLSLRLNELLEGCSIEELTQINNIVCDRMCTLHKGITEKNRDLIVRVAGYSDYFIDLPKELQDEIIRRTEQGETC